MARWGRPFLPLWLLLLYEGVVLLVAYAFYLPTLRGLLREWTMPGVNFYSHGLLVVLFVLLLVIRRRYALLRPSHSPWGVLALGVAPGLYFLGERADLPFITAFSFVVFLWALLLLLFGTEAARRLLFPYAYLLVAVPLPPILWASVALIQVVGPAAGLLANLGGPGVSYVPTFLLASGSAIPIGELRIQEYTYLVVPLCSGINLILALYALLLPFLYVTHHSWRRTLLFAAAIPVVALVVKIVLLAVVVRLTPLLGQDLAVEYYHRWLGVPAFLIALFALFIPILVTRPKGQPLLGAW